jgi:hypothetical protein
VAGAQLQDDHNKQPLQPQIVYASFKLQTWKSSDVTKWVLNGRQEQQSEGMLK